MKISRDLLIKQLSKALKSVNYVNALWLEGADSLGTVDEFSDIDVWIDVEDGKEEAAVDKIRQVLSTLGEIDFDYEKNHDHPKIRQYFFHLEGSSKFLIIDLCVQSNSRVFWFTKDKDGEKVKILFDKKNVINFKPLNKKEFIKEITERKEYLMGEFKIMQVDVEKELERNDYLGALNFYLSLANIFTELLRIEHSPTKHEFGLKHVSRDFPKDATKLLSKIYSFSSIDDLKRNVNLMSKNI
ncbi:MAG: hypothetical protein PHT36_00290 [Patescibacteria group bacterium]|nr:hypothetical protein [Patescibacteria group bacterium]